MKEGKGRIVKIDDTLHTDATCPCCGKELRILYQRMPAMRILGLVDSNGVMASAQGNPNAVDAIYAFWNSQHIVVHRSMTPDTAKAIRAELRHYTDSEIMQAIRNYAEIQRGEQYWFKYAWTLRDFLKRGLPKFLDSEIAKKNYMKRAIQPQQGKPLHKECPNCGYKSLTADTSCPQCGGTLTKDYKAGRYAHLVQR